MPPADLPRQCGEFTISSGHPSLAGHFPGDPLVPGVLLLDHALGLLGRAGTALQPLQVLQLRFRAPVRAGERVILRSSAAGGQTLDLAGFVEGREVFSGRLRLPLRGRPDAAPDGSCQ